MGNISNIKTLQNLEVVSDYTTDKHGFITNVLVSYNNKHFTLLTKTWDSEDFNLLADIDFLNTEKAYIKATEAWLKAESPSKMGVLEARHDGKQGRSYVKASYQEGKADIESLLETALAENSMSIEFLKSLETIDFEKTQAALVNGCYICSKSLESAISSVSRNEKERIELVSEFLNRKKAC